MSRQVNFKFERKFITLTLQHVSPLQVNSGVWFQKKPLRPQVTKPRKQLLSKLFCVCNSQQKKLNAMLRNFFYCKLLNTQNVLQRSHLTHCLNCALRNAWHLDFTLNSKLLLTLTWSVLSMKSCQVSKLLLQTWQDGCATVSFLGTSTSEACLSLLGKTPRHVIASAWV
jgi:hypothetical protein